MAENDDTDRGQTTVETGSGGEVAVLDALHLDGKEVDTLDDGEAVEASTGATTEAESVGELGNIQTGRRQTFEAMVAGQPPQGAAVPVDDRLRADDYRPSEPDNAVQSLFQAEQPRGQAGPRADQVEEEVTAEDRRPPEAAPLDTPPQPPAAEPATDAGAGGAAAPATPAPEPEAEPMAAAGPAVGTTEDDDDEEEPVLPEADTAASAPTLTTQDTAGLEDTAIPLTIGAGLADTDGSESLTIYVTGLPAGASLSNGTPLAAPIVLNGQVLPAGSTWRLSAADANGLTVTPPTNDSADFTLSVWAVSTESLGGATAVTGPRTIDVDVGVVAPSAAGSGQGHEGPGWTDIDLSASVNADLPGSQETLTVFIEDLPAGAQLRLADTGTVLTPAAGRYDVTGRLDNLQVRWADEHQGGNISFTLRAEVTDSDVGTSRESAIDRNQTVTTVTVAIADVADAPTLSATDVGGMEDSWIGVAVTGLGLVDRDGSETLTLYVEDVPPGAQLRLDAASGLTVEQVTAPVTLTSQAGGSRDLAGDGSVFRIAIPGADGLSAEQILAKLATLEVRPAAGSSADFTLKLVAVSEELAGEAEYGAGRREQAWSEADVHVDVGVLAPIVTASNRAGAEGAAWIALDGLGVAVAAPSAGAPEEQITVTLTGLPDGVSLIDADGHAVAQQRQPDGTFTADVSASWNRTSGQVEGLRIKWTDPDASGDITFTLRAVVRDTDATTPGGDRDTLGSTPDARGDGTADENVATRVVTVSVAPVVDDASARFGADGGVEDAGTPADTTDGFALSPTITLSADPSEHLTGTVRFDLADASLGRLAWVPAAGGPAGALVDDGGGHYRLESAVFKQAGRELTIDPAKGSLVLIPTEHSDVDVAYRMTFTVDDLGVTRDFTADATIAITAAADAPALAAAPVGGLENSWIGLAVTDLGLVDRDGSESLSLYVDGVPTGAALSIAPDSGLAIVADGASYRIDIPAAHGLTNDQIVAKLATLAVRPPADGSDDFTLTLRAVSTEADGGATATATASLHVDVGVRAATVASRDYSGGEAGWVALDDLGVGVTAASAGMAEESLAVILTGLPAGVLLTDANGNPVPQAAEPGGTFAADVRGYWNPATGKVEGLRVKWADDDASGPITFTVKATVSDRDATMAGRDLDGLGSIPDARGDGTADVAVATHAVTVTVLPVADQAAVTATSAGGVEDKWVHLDLDWAVSDPSEVIHSALLSGFPPGTELRHAVGGGAFASITVGADGVADLTSLTPAQQQTLYARLPDDVSSHTEAGGVFNLSLAVTTRESALAEGEAGATATKVVPFSITVFGDADAPGGSTRGDAVTLGEGAFHTLTWGTDLSAALGDATAETLTVFIAPVDANARLTIGGVEQAKTGGGWTLAVGQIQSGAVAIAGPLHWGTSGTEPHQVFKVYAVATEQDADPAASRFAGLTNPETGTGLSRQASTRTEIGELRLAPSPDADAVVFAQTSDSGKEDTAIAVAPTITLVDQDGSEALSGFLYIETSDPAMLAGTLVHNGTTLTAFRVTEAGSESANPVVDPAQPYAPGATGSFAYRIPVVLGADTISGTGMPGDPYVIRNLSFT
ncbi:MAG: hypothetical protein AB1918_00695, partial [Pseudomonadota bacterium]